MKLSKRLSAIYELVDNAANVADIGADHGQLIISLMKNKSCGRGFCNDNKLGPYRRLSAAITKANLGETVEVSLSSGIEKLPNYIDTIILAGMGGDLIVALLKAYPEKLTDTLILAPNTQIPFVREEMCKLGYYISAEEIIFERHYYEIIKFKKSDRNYSPDEIFFGPILMKKRSPIFLEKYQKRQNEIKDLLKKELNIFRRQQLQAEYERIEKL